MPLQKMQTTVDQKEELIRVLGRLGIGPLELLASLKDEIVVLNRHRRAVALLGNWPDESSPRPDQLLGKTVAEMFGPELAALHETAHRRALQGEHVAYEWTRR